MQVKHRLGSRLESRYAHGYLNSYVDGCRHWRSGRVRHRDEVRALIWSETYGSQPGWTREIAKPLTRDALADDDLQFDLEKLEDRLMLAVDVAASGGTITFTDHENPINGVDLALTEVVYIRENASGELEYSQNKVSGWSSSFGGTVVKPADHPVVKIDGSKIATIELVGRISTDGGDLEILALDELRGLAGTTLSTRNLIGVGADPLSGDSEGDSGAMTLKAPKISFTGSSLLTHVQTGGAFNSGAITIEARMDSDLGLILPFADLRISEAKVTLNGTSVQGGNISISAISDSADLFDGTGTLTQVAEGLLENYVAAFSPLAGYAKSTADANISVHGGLIEGRNVTMTSDSRAEAVVLAAGFGLGVAVGETDTKSQVILDQSAQITASGNVLITADSWNRNAPTAGNISNMLSPFHDTTSVMVSVGVTDILARTHLDATSRIDAGGNVSMDASSTKFMSVITDASIGANGKTASAVSISIANNTTESIVDGTVVARGDGQFSAMAAVMENDTSAKSAPGLSPAAGVVARPLAGFASGLIRNGGFDAARSVHRQTGVSLSFAFMDHNNLVVAQVGPGAVVDVGGNLNIAASSVDLPQLAASAYVPSTNVNGKFGAARNTASRSFAIALSVGLVKNNASAVIGHDAVVSVGGNLQLASAAQIPFVIKFLQFKQNPLKFFTEKMNANFGIQNGFFTSWAENYAEGQEFALGGSTSVLEVDSNSQARVDDRARVTVGGDMTVRALSENETLNFVGQAWPLPAGAVSGGSGVGGSVAFVSYTNTTLAEIRSDAVVDAGTLFVYSNSDDRNMNVSVQGGQADEFAFNGALSSLSVLNTSIARIDEGAQVTTGAGNIRFAQEIVTPVNAQIGGQQTFTSARPQFLPTQQIGTDAQGAPVFRVANDTVTLPYEHNLVTGQPVLYDSGGDSPIGGLTTHTVYYVIVPSNSTNTVQLATTAADAAAGVVIPLVLPTNASGSGHSLLPVFQNAAVNDQTYTIDLGYRHGLSDGDALEYILLSTGATDTPLITQGTYYAIVVDDTHIQLAPTATAARAPVPSPLSLTIGALTGNLHILSPIASTPKVISLPWTLDSNNNGKLDVGDEHILEAREAASGTVHEILPFRTSEHLYVTDTSLLVIAEDGSEIYNFGGAITLGRETGVGASIAINRIRRDTQAIIGDRAWSLLTEDGFAPGVGIDSSGLIDLGYRHGFQDGDAVTYTSGGDTMADRLQDGDTYYANAVSTNTLRLARSIAESIEDSLTQFQATDVTGNVIDLGYTHQYQLGDAVVYSNGGGLDVGGLVDGQTYYVVPVDATQVALVDHFGKATGTYDFVFDPRETIDGDTIVLGYVHGIASDTPLRYTAGGGTPISGLADGSVYYAQDDRTVGLTLAATPGGTGIAIAALPENGAHHTLQRGFELQHPQVTLDVAEDRIQLPWSHGYSPGDRVQYHTNGTPIQGLSDGDVLYVSPIDGDTFALATTHTAAMAGIQHFFDPASTVYLDNSTIDLGGTLHFQTGDEVVYSANGDTPIAELTDGGTYFVTVVDAQGNIVHGSPTHTSATRVRLASTQSDAIAGNNLTLTAPASTNLFHYIRGTNLIDLTASASTDAHFFTLDQSVQLDSAVGTGTSHTLRLDIDGRSTRTSTHGIGKTFDPNGVGVVDALHTIDLGYSHGFNTGDRVVYSNGAGTSIDGLGHGSIYFVIAIDGTRIQLAETATAASRGVALELDASVASGIGHGFGLVFRPLPMIDNTTDTITFDTPHGMNTGDSIIYRNGGGTSIGGLNDGDKVYVIVVDPMTVKLASSQANATAMTPVPLAIDPSVATGRGHSFTQEDSATGFVTSGGKAFVAAANLGTVVSASLAGTATTKTPGGSIATGKFQAGSVKAGDAGGNRSSTAVAGSVVINVIADKTYSLIENAIITSTDLHQLSLNRAYMYTGVGAIALALTGGSSAGIAGAVDVSVIDNDTRARLHNSTVTTNMDTKVESVSEGTILGIAMGGSFVSGKYAFAGSVVVNSIDSNALAHVTDSTLHVGNLAVSAIDRSQAWAIAGSAAVTIGSQDPGGAFGVGAAVALNLINNDEGTEAFIDNSEVTATGNVDASALTDSKGQTYSFGLAFVSSSVSFSMAAALAASVNVVDTSTRARIRRTRPGGTGVVAGGHISVHTDDRSDIKALAGGVAVGLGSNSAAAGLGFAMNIIDGESIAVIEQSDVQASELSVNATTNGTIHAAAIGGAGAEKFAIGGSFTFNKIKYNSEASIKDQSSVVVNGTNLGVSVVADDNSTIRSLAGAAGFSTTASVGVAVAYNEIDNNIKAFIQNGATGSTSVTSSAGDVMVSAGTSSSIETISIGIGGSTGQVGLAGSAGVAKLDNVVEAFIDNATVTADGNLLVLADQSNLAATYGGAAGIGLQMGGFGGTAMVNLINNTTNAYVYNSTIESKGNRSGVPVKNWDFQVNETTQFISGMAVIASAKETIRTISAAIGAGKDAAAGIDIGTTFVTDNTNAYIEHSTVNSTATPGGDVIVRASQVTDSETASGAAGISIGVASVGVAVDNVDLRNTTKAWIGQGRSNQSVTSVYSRGNVDVSTHTKERVQSVAVGVSIAGNVALAGSGSGVYLNNTHEAFIRGATVKTTRSLTVTNNDYLDLDVYGGAASIAFNPAGSVAGGGTVAIVDPNNRNEASIVNSTVDALRATTVSSTSLTAFNAIEGNLAGGFHAAINGTVIFADFDMDTIARITDSQVNQDVNYRGRGQFLNVRARDTVNTDTKIGNVSAAIGAIGGAFDILNIQNTVDAHIDGATSVVYAQGGISVNADTERNINSLAVAAAAGGTTLTGSLSLISIGSGTSSGGASELDSTTLSRSESTVGVGQGGNVGLSPSGPGGSAQNALSNQSHPTTQQVLAATHVNVQDVAAYVGAGVDIATTGSMTVAAREMDFVTATDGAVSVAAAGFGGAFSSVSIATQVESFIDNGVNASAAFGVNVSADAQEFVNTRAYGGAGTLLLGVGLQFAEINSTGSQRAFIDDNAVITNTGRVTVSANHNRNLDSQTAGGAIGAIAAGASVARATSGGSVDAFIGKNVNIGTQATNVGNVDVRSTSTDSIAASAIAGVGGIVAGSGAEGTVTINPTLNAYVDNGAVITSNGDVTINADATTFGDSKARGVNVSGVASGGASLATTDVSPTINAWLGSNAVIDAASLSILAGQGLDPNQQYTSKAYGFGVAASLMIGVQGSKITSRSGTSATATLGSSANVTTTGNVLVESDVVTSQFANSDAGSGGGLLAVGINLADISNTTSSVAQVANNAAITAGSLNVHAMGTDTLKADASTHSGSLLGSFGGAKSGYASDVKISMNPSTHAIIGSGTNSTGLIDINGPLTMLAKHTNSISGSSNNHSGAGIVGVGGARFVADINQSDVVTSIGGSRRIQAESFNVASENVSTGGDIAVYSATGGGIVGVSGAEGRVNVNHNTTSKVLGNAQLPQTGTGANIGEFAITATNDMSFPSLKVSVESGGVLNGSEGRATVTAPTYNATVDIDRNVTLVGLEDVRLGAWATGDGFAFASATSGGIVVADALADANANVTANNTIIVQGFANITAGRDVDLLAGQDRVLKELDDPRVRRNDLRFDATGSGVAAAAGAIGTGSGRGDVTQTNKVDVRSNAIINTEADANLVADEGIAIATDFSYGADYSVSTTRNTHHGTSTNIVQVDGTVNVGTDNQRFLTINEDGTFPATNDVVVAAPSQLLLNAAIEARVNELVALSSIHAGTPSGIRYDAEIQFWVRVIQDLGGVATYDAQTGTVTVDRNIVTAVYDIPATKAESGDINVTADSLFGSGILNAPGDTRIEIINHSDASIRLADLTIPDDGGGRVRLNERSITANADITNPHSGTVSFTINAAGNTPDPVILVRNVQHHGHSRVAHVLAQGDIFNPDGVVTLDAAAGSLIISGSVSAGTLNASSGGDFVVSNADTDGDGFVHFGGDPRGLYSTHATANEAAGQAVSNPSTVINGTGGVISAGNVFVSGRNLNINGLIQSGVPEHVFTIPASSALDAAISAANTSYRANAANRFTTLPSNLVTYTADNTSGQLVNLVWDARDQELELDASVKVRGGFIQLIGNIVNTGGGHLKAMDGYGEVRVQNDSDYTLMVRDLDVGRGTSDGTGIEGVIDIIDTAKYPREHTRYTRLGDQVHKTVNNGSPVTTNAPIGAVDPNVVHATYVPRDVRFYWETSQRVDSAEVYELNNQGVQQSHAFVQANGTLISNVVDRTRNIDTARYWQSNYTNSSAVYEYRRESHVFTGSQFMQVNLYIDREWLTGREVGRHYDHRLDVSLGRLVSHVHNVGGGEPIDITFMGNEGLVSVDSQGSVVIGGALAARGGHVRVTSHNGSIESTDSNAALIGDTITLTAASGIGLNGPLYTNQSNVSGPVLVATTAHGDVSIEDVGGNLVVSDVRTGSGDVTLASTIGSVWAAPSRAVHVTGSSVTINANNGVGSSTERLQVNTGSLRGQTLAIRAGGDVWVGEVSGDLSIDQIIGNRIDMTVPGGRVIDGFNDTGNVYDQAARDALLTLWNEQAVIGNAAERRVLEAISRYRTAREAEYYEYFRVTNGGSYDPALTFTFSQGQTDALLASGYTQPDIDSLATQATDRYHYLGGVFGELGTYRQRVPSFNPFFEIPTFTYQLTQAEIDQVSAGLVFNAEDLLFALPAATVKRTSNTQASIEQPKITGTDINVVAGGSFGEGVVDVQYVPVPNGEFNSIQDDANHSVKVSLMSAESDDLAFFSWVETSGDGIPQRHELTPWIDVNGNQLIDSDEFNVIELTLRQDVDIQATGGLTVTSGAEVMVGASHDLRLDTVTAGTNQDIRVKSAGSVTAGLDNAATNVIGRNVVIESGREIVGAENRPMIVDLNGSLIARADGRVDVFDASGSFEVASIFSNGHVRLGGIGSIVDANDVGNLAVTNLLAASAELNAPTVGSLANPFDVELVAPNNEDRLSGEVTHHLHVASGRSLTIDDLTSTQGSLHVQSNESIGLGFARAQTDITFISDQGSITDVSPIAINLQAANIDLSAPNGAIGSLVNPVDYAAGSSITASSAMPAYVAEAVLPTGRLSLLSEFSGTSAGDLQFHDFNGDGHPDALVSGRYAINDGMGGFTVSPLPGVTPQLLFFGSAAADFDQDGDLDIVFSTGPQEMLMFINQGGSQGGVEGEFVQNGSFNPNVVPSNFTRLRLRATDLDGDGDADIVTENAGRDQIHTYFNDGAGGFSTGTASGLDFGLGFVGSLGFSRQLIPADLDGDFDQDLVIVHYAGARGNPTQSAAAVLINDGSGRFTQSSMLGSTPLDARYVALDDIDHDGDLDAVVSSVSSNEIWLNDGSASFSDSGLRIGVADTRAVSLGDMDFDGDVDALVSARIRLPSPIDQHTVWFNDGGGTFSQGGQTVESTIDSPTGLSELIDVDGNGNLDAVIGIDVGDFSSTFRMMVWQNQSRPVINSASLPFAENPRNGSTIGTVRVTERDVTDSLIFAINRITGTLADTSTVDLSAAVSIDPSTGEITVLDGTLFDADTLVSAVMNVTVTDSVGLPDTRDVTLDIANLQVAPVIDTPGFRVLETIPSGTIVGTVMITDSEVLIGDYLTDVSIAAPHDTDWLIDLDGQITYVGSGLNAETNSKVDLTINATDADGNSGSKVVGIAVGNVNEPPYLPTTDGFTYPDSFTILNFAAVGTVVGQIQAIDPEGDPVTYEIKQGFEGIFDIDANGVITVKDNTLFSRSGMDTTYAVYVKPTDVHGLAYSDQDNIGRAFVHIQLLEENKPQLTDATVEIFERGLPDTTVIDLDATDADIPNGDVLTYSILHVDEFRTNGQSTRHDNAHIFQIDPATGVVSMDASGLDAAITDRFVLRVRVQDSTGLNNFAIGWPTDINLTVNVGNTPDAPIVSNQVVTLNENRLAEATTFYHRRVVDYTAFGLGVFHGVDLVTSGPTVVTQVTATDLDLNETFTYAIDSQPVARAAQVIGDTISVASSYGGWTDVWFPTPFDEIPVVIATPTTQGLSPSTVRVFEVTRHGFRVLVAEPQNEDGVTDAMEVTYLAMTPGEHTIGGMTFEAGTLDTAAVEGDFIPGQRDALTFNSTFTQTPALLTGLQTIRNESKSLSRMDPFMVVSVNDLTTTGATLAIDRLQTYADDLNLAVEALTLPALSAGETIGYIAVQSGGGQVVDTNGSSVDIQALLSGHSVVGWDDTNGKGTPTHFSTPFAAAPGVLASIASYQNNEGGWVRVGNVTGDQVNLVIDEDQEYFLDRSHTTPENVSVFAFSQPFIIEGDSTTPVFGIDPDTGVITVTNASYLDYEDTNARENTQVVVRVTDSGGLSSTAVISVVPVDIHQPPTGGVSAVTGALDETETSFGFNPTPIGNMSDPELQLDADGDRVGGYFYWPEDGRYHTTDRFGAFEVFNPLTYDIRLIDNTWLDLDTPAPGIGPRFDTELVFVDTEGNIGGNHFMQLTLNAIEEAPVLAAKQSIPVSEAASSGQYIGTVNYLNRQANQLFSITAGNDQGVFAIDSATGDIRVTDETLLDFETTPIHELTVSLSDGVTTATMPLSIIV